LPPLEAQTDQFRWSYIWSIGYVVTPFLVVVVVVVVCVHTGALVLSCHLLGPTSGTNFVEPKANFLRSLCFSDLPGGSICWDPKRPFCSQS